MGRLNVPGMQHRVPGTRNSQNPHQSRHVPGVPGVPPLRARVRVSASRMRASEFFPVRAYREHPEHPEQTSGTKAFGCSGYPEHQNHTRNMQKMAKPLRETMPLCAGFIDEMRQAFGAAEINASIKAGIEGQPTFYASENGVEIGTKDTRPGFPLSRMVIDAPGATVQAGRAKK
jgi:hypothetical protein